MKTLLILKSKTIVVAITLVCLHAFIGVQLVSADLISFEIIGIGLGEGAEVPPIVTATNTVRIGTTTGVAAGPCDWTERTFIAQVGAPRFAFGSNDTPNGQGISNCPGIFNFFITDENTGNLEDTDNYSMHFECPVISLELDVLDYRVDGGPVAGDTATLTVFDAAGTAIGADIYTIPPVNPPDGNVVRLAVPNPAGLISCATVVFSTGDVGTGIDNIRFETVCDCN